MNYSQLYYQILRDSNLLSVVGWVLFVACSIVFVVACVSLIILVKRYPRVDILVGGIVLTAILLAFAYCLHLVTGVFG